MAAFYSRFYQEAWGAAVLSFFVPMDDALEHMAALWDGKKKKKIFTSLYMVTMF